MFLLYIQVSSEDQMGLLLQTKHNSVEIASSTNGLLDNSKSSKVMKKVDLVTLANVNKDCFIIPVASVDRFLPPGISVCNYN